METANTNAGENFFVRIIQQLRERIITCWYFVSSFSLLHLKPRVLKKVRTKPLNEREREINKEHGSHYSYFLDKGFAQSLVDKRVGQDLYIQQGRQCGNCADTF